MSATNYPARPAFYPAPRPSLLAAMEAVERAMTPEQKERDDRFGKAAFERRMAGDPAFRRRVEAKRANKRA